jgi:hypothetical protein
LALPIDAMVGSIIPYTDTLDRRILKLQGKYRKCTLEALQWDLYRIRSIYSEPAAELITDFYKIEFQN